MLVAAVGLVVADIVVYDEIGAYLNNQVDIQLQTSAQITLAQLGHGCSERLPLNTAAEVVSTSGTPLCSVPSGFRITTSQSLLAPLLTAPIGSSMEFTASGSLSGKTGSYRVLAENVSVFTFGSPLSPGIALLAVPLSGLEGTLDQLVLVEGAVSAAVLAVLVALGYAVVRVGLRPLERIEDTAGQIAAGDLSLRVERADPATEVGRLGAALNAMLAQIEHAFTEQHASENRLRQFLADASHELRTPVTSIRGYAELFRRGAASRPEDLALAMRRIEDEAARMGVLVDDLLLLARLDQGRPLERAPVDLAAIAIDAAADAQVLDARPHDHGRGPGTGRRRRATSSASVRSSRTSSQNALRHTPPGTAVEVSVRSDGGRAVLAVHDDGPGHRAGARRRTSSSASTAPTPPAPAGAAARASASRSSPRSPRPTAAWRVSRRPPAPVAPSSWSFLSRAGADTRRRRTPMLRGMALRRTASRTMGSPWSSPPRIASPRHPPCPRHRPHRRRSPSERRRPTPSSDAGAEPTPTPRLTPGARCR